MTQRYVINVINYKRISIFRIDMTATLAEATESHNVCKSQSEICFYCHFAWLYMMKKSSYAYYLELFLLTL